MADSKITGFLSKDTAGLPNWAWLLVVGAGIAAVYVIPKFTGNKASSTNASSSTDTSGLGLAVDPTTGLPYAVEGLVPSGAGAGGGGITVSGTNPPPPSNGIPPTFLGPPQQPPSNGGIAYRIANGIDDTLQGYSNYFGTPVARLLDLNPALKQYGPTGILPKGTRVAVWAPIGNALSPTVTSPTWPGGTQQVRLTSG